MEFFSGDPREPDERLLATMGVLGLQVGQFVPRRRAEAEVRANEFRLRAILDAALDAIVTMSAEGRVTGWNPAAQETFGHTAAEALGRDMAERAAALASPMSSTQRQDLRSPDARDAAANRNYPPSPMVVTLKPVAAPESVADAGFDWIAAGIGAAIALGMILLATAAVLLTRRHAHRHQPVATA